MDLLEYERYLQQQRQKKAIDSRLNKGITRIGERIPQTDRYEVLNSDGSKNPNGIKIFTATHKIGDIVLPYPRNDGTIALDSYKASEAPIEEEPKRQETKKPGAWIFYESAGKIWIGGHQSAPVEIGSIGEFGNLWAGYSSNQKLELASALKCHVWGCRDRWIASFTNAYEADPNSVTGLITLTTIDTGLKKTVSMEFSPYGSNNPWLSPLDLTYKINPVGGGLFFYSRLGASTSTTRQTFLGFWDGQNSTIEAIDTTVNSTSVTPHPKLPSTGWSQGIQVKSASGQVPIPGSNQKGIRTLTGSAADYTSSWGTAEFTSEIDYVILSDGLSTFWVKETLQTSTGWPTYPLVFFNGATTPSGGDFVIRSYTLYNGSTKIKTQSTPDFFGIEWLLRPSGTPYTQQMPDDFPPSPEQSLHYFGPSWVQEGVTSCGVFRRSIAGLSQSSAIPDPYWDFPGGMPVSLVNGQVVGIPSDEIVRAKGGGGIVRRVGRSIDGQEHDMAPVYVFGIPSDALIYHWCCDA